MSAPDEITSFISCPNFEKLAERMLGAILNFLSLVIMIPKIVFIYCKMRILPLFD